MPTLNKQTLDRLELAGTGRKSNVAQYQVRDDELRGFFVTVGKSRITFQAQVETYRNGKRIKTEKRKIGTYPEMTADAARKIARDLMTDMRRGETEPTRGRLTFAEAWAKLREGMVNDVAEGSRSPRTLEGYDYMFTKLTALHDYALADLSADPTPVEKTFNAIRAEGHRTTAFHAMMFLGRVYRVARKKKWAPLPAYVPTEGLEDDMKNAKPKPRRHRTMSKEELPGWWRQLQAHPNAIRREFHLINLLTGSRQTALAELRWEDIDFDRGTIHFPKPKGGTEKAYTIPMTSTVRAALERCKEAGALYNRKAARDWVFPGHPDKSRKEGSEVTHLVNWSEDREDLYRWGEDLRKTFRSLSAQGGMTGDVLKIFMNHADRDVTDRYLAADKVDRDYIRAKAEAYNQYLMDCLLKEPEKVPA